MDKFVKKKSTKSNLIFLRKLGQKIYVIKKPLIVNFLEGDFVIFRPMVGEILNLKYFFKVGD